MDSAVKAAFITAAATITAALIPVGFANHWFSPEHPAASSSSPPTRSPSRSPHSAAASGSPNDTWVAQLASVRIGAGQAQLHKELSLVQSEVPGARYLNSSDYGSLRGGYWMIYYAGSFTNGQQALAYCAAHGLTTGNQCLGRFVSHNPADRTDMCFPPAASPSGDCTEP
jgi:eukaryotic-like serine/threonine-protein kinase